MRNALRVSCLRRILPLQPLLPTELTLGRQTACGRSSAMTKVVCQRQGIGNDPSRFAEALDHYPPLPARGSYATGYC
jgi:hypothetical protein